MGFIGLQDRVKDRTLKNFDLQLLKLFSFDMTVSSQPDYHIKASTPAPVSYPAGPTPDSFSEQPFLPNYESRRAAFFEHILKNPAPENTKAGWHELARLAAGGSADRLQWSAGRAAP